jgi:hypothetical protein
VTTKGRSPVAIEILNDPAGVFARVAQAGQLAIDELVLGAVERQLLLAVHQLVYDLFQIHRVAYI